MNVQVETSGTVWQELELDWITLSPKDLFSKKKTLDYFGVDANEIKCVVTKDSDVDYYLDTYGIFCNDAKPIIFQLVDNDTSLSLARCGSFPRLERCKLFITAFVFNDRANKHSAIYCANICTNDRIKNVVALFNLT